MGFCHVENSFYLDEGWNGKLLNSSYLSTFRKLVPSGEVAELEKMPTPKSVFAITLWKNALLLWEGGMNVI